VAFDVRDAKTLVLTLPVGSLPFDADQLRVHVGTTEGTVGREVTDPAGNAMPRDRAVATGVIQ
jgi:hypothetical protein